MTKIAKFFQQFFHLQELAKYYGVSPVVLEGLPHDSMLDLQWKEVADIIRGFLQKV